MRAVVVTKLANRASSLFSIWFRRDAVLSSTGSSLLAPSEDVDGAGDADVDGAGDAGDLAGVPELPLGLITCEGMLVLLLLVRTM